MPLPPTGTVTFLFTDIEGSTRLWEQHPDAMRPALARHDDLLRRSIEDNGGFVFKTAGDAFCAAFPTANLALQAALASQLALAAEPWDLPTPLAVRMALHTGTAEERGGDYFGQPLNRVARLMAAGHGGQTLLSDVTQGLVRDALPPQSSLRDLGQHRLKDLGRPEQVFQLLHPALPADFPPLRSLDNPALPNNLPQQTTSFIGRETQVAEVKALLAKTRLLTLTGAGGSGKTRLSLQVAADLLDGEGDGVWLVELAALADPALVPQTVADVLGVTEQAGKTVQQALVEWLRTRRLLLILDNCEHLVSACASLAADILRACPGVHLLASSREPLAVAGEQTYRVPSLSLPDPRQAQTVESLSQYEAVRLFLERAQAVQPSFSVTDANAPAVAQICFHLDGIPLAIEMAAARVRSLSVEEINRRLDQRFRLLTGGSRTALPRQQTLRALIDWSYDLLTEAEKTLLCRLSVFAGGWTLAAAEGVCSGGDAASGDIEDWEVLDLLTGLVDKSLAVYEEGADGDSGRYRLLESVRQYAGDRLGESGEADAARGRSASWFLGLAAEAGSQLQGPEAASWLGRLEREHDNLRAGLSWYDQSADGEEDGVRLAGALWRFWLVRGHYSEGRQWLGQALARTSPGIVSPGTLGQGGAEVGTGAAASGAAASEAAASEAAASEAAASGAAASGAAARARALSGAGNLAWAQADYAGARALYEESLTLARQLEDQLGTAYALGNLGNLAFNQGEYAEAWRMSGEGLTIFRQLGNQQGIAHALGNLGNVAWAQSDYAGARALFEESLTLARQLEDQRGTAVVLGNLGSMASTQGDYVGARALHEESLTLLRQLGDQQGIAEVLINLGNVAYNQGDRVGAASLYAESLTLWRQLGNQVGIAGCLESVAGVAQGQNRPSRATRLVGAASALRESVGSPRIPVDQAGIDEMLAAMREALGEDAFAAAWDAGQAMTLEQAVEYALSEGE